MTQVMIDLLTCEEYTNYLAYGEPVSVDTASRYQTEQHEDENFKLKVARHT